MPDGPFPEAEEGEIGVASKEKKHPDLVGGINRQATTMPSQERSISVPPCGASESGNDRKLVTSRGASSNC
jgi:hypothetical protein